jgi:hypothetical protein
MQPYQQLLPRPQKGWQTWLGMLAAVYILSTTLIALQQLHTHPLPLQLPCALTSSPRCAGSFCVRVAVIPLHVQGGDLDTQEQSVTPSTLMRLTMSNMQPHDTKLW